MQVQNGMNKSNRPSRRAEALKRLLERLESPDVTLPEAKALRAEVATLLGESFSSQQAAMH